MPANCIPHKETGLIRGDAKKIASRHRVSIVHTCLVAKRLHLGPEFGRPGRPALRKTIRQYQERAAALASGQAAA